MFSKESCTYDDSRKPLVKTMCRVSERLPTYMCGAVWERLGMPSPASRILDWILSAMREPSTDDQNSLGAFVCAICATRLQMSLSSQLKGIRVNTGGVDLPRCDTF